MWLAPLVLAALQISLPAVVAAPEKPAAKPKPCTATVEVVILWHKESDAAGQKAVLEALKARCLVSSEQIVGMRAQAMEMAHDLERPLFAFKARTDKATGRVMVTADRVDATQDELKVVVHVDATDDVAAAVARVVTVSP